MMVPAGLVIVAQLHLDDTHDPMRLGIRRIHVKRFLHVPFSGKDVKIGKITGRTDPHGVAAAKPRIKLDRPVKP